MVGAPKKKKKADKSTLIIYGAVGFVFLAVIGFLASLIFSDMGPRKKEHIAVVNLMKPPPPPEQKPPEPVPPKEAPKQEVIQDILQPQDAPQNDQPQDDTPAGQDLGVDAEGGAGGDGFGLVGKKGGRSILGGGGGLSRMSLLTKYGWYTKKVEKELWRDVKSILDQQGGIPKGKHYVTVHLILSGKGAVISSRIVDPSGNEKIDRALKTALASLKVSEPLPEGMPTGMTIRVSSQG